MEEPCQIALLSTAKVRPFNFCESEGKNLYTQKNKWQATREARLTSTAALWKLGSLGPGYVLIHV